MFLRWWREKSSIERSNSLIFGTMLLAGVIGLLAAFVLTLEKFHLLQEPDAQLSCSLNAVLNCASVMKTWQSSLFGFPNPIIGLMGYSVVITVAVAGLWGVRFPKKFMVLAQVGYGLGLIFAYWLFFQSVYAIQVLCPWCLLVTVVTTILFDTLLRYNLRENNFSLPETVHAKALSFLAKDYDKLIVVGWLVLMAALVFLKFGDGLWL
ncbi:MAG TPA: vitamin K epoxide reductase family protein [Verrucomicrobiae bacterium]|nr:vitamin K epoxide reductase family protein [Verrucomicrobiae bacterium]